MKVRLEETCVAKKKESRFDAAGWLFWFITFGVLLIPSIWLLWNRRPEDSSWLYPLGMGTVIAAIGAGFVTWIINAVMQWRLKKKHIEERKKAKKH